MLVIKAVKVHEDTHRVLKLLKDQNRSKSMDEVIRELVKRGTGKSIEQFAPQKKNTKITAFVK
jgi:predicted CopG family antitoxin